MPASSDRVAAETSVVAAANITAVANKGRIRFRMAYTFLTLSFGVQSLRCNHWSHQRNKRED
jgi:hypothetical protein